MTAATGSNPAPGNSPSSPVTYQRSAVDRATGARAGILHTPHGDIPTPVFMPVGTQGTVKTLDPRELRALGTRILLNNTYHLYLRPGPDLVAQLGGVHRFMAWEGAILTDSGGFQVFSLAHLHHISDDGVTFASHLDGQPVTLTPESAVAIQEQLGADIAMVLDQPAPYPADVSVLRETLDRTHRWAERSRAAQRRPDQALFGIVQGGTDARLRQESARVLRGMDFPGYAVGGLCLGEPKDVMNASVEAAVGELPDDKPRYLMGVGSPEDLVEGVARGVDMFDCALPTRVARNGGLYTRRGRVIIRNARFTEDFGPVDSGCDCLLCTQFTAAYLRQLFLSGEQLALRLATLHNVRFLTRLMEDARGAIVDGTFAQWREEFWAGYTPIGTADAPRPMSRRSRTATAESSK